MQLYGIVFRNLKNMKKINYLKVIGNYEKTIKNYLLKLIILIIYWRRINERNIINAPWSNNR